MTEITDWFPPRILLSGVNYARVCVCVCVCVCLRRSSGCAFFSRRRVGSQTRSIRALIERSWNFNLSGDERFSVKKDCLLTFYWLPARRYVFYIDIYRRHNKAFNGPRIRNSACDAPFALHSNNFTKTRYLQKYESHRWLYKMTTGLLKIQIEILVINKCLIQKSKDKSVFGV